MLERTQDAERVNRILNHPDVLPWVKLDGQESLDASALAADAANVVLAADGGCFIFVHAGVAAYEVHTNFTRGVDVLPLAREAAQYMFCRTDCMRLHTKVPVDNRAARILTKKMGFRRWFDRVGCFPRNGVLHDVEYYALDIHDWLLESDAAIAEGRRFHEALGDLKDHADDAAHDQVAGGCLLMARHHPQKAMALYNQWASFAGYEPGVYWDGNVMFRNMKVTFKESGYEVQSCQ